VPTSLCDRIAWLCRRFHQAQTLTDGLTPTGQEKKWRRFWRAITPIGRSIAHWLGLAEKHTSPPSSENIWRYEPPTIPEIFPFGETETRHHSHDIIRRYFPAGDLKILITIFQASNYGLLTDRLNAAGLLIEKAMIDVAEWFMNANSLDGE